MASIISQTPAFESVVEPVPRSFTAADLAALPDELPSGPVNFELEDGRLMPMSPTGWFHGNLQSRIAKELITQGEEKGHGKAVTEAGVVLGRRPDSVAGPDVAFISNRSMPLRASPEGYLETIPELVVEIRSKNDSVVYLNRKVAKYLKLGVQLVWIVDPQSRTVVEYRPVVEPKTLTVTDALVCDDIIPGFRHSLAELFKE